MKSSYSEKIRQFSEELITIQKPIRILDAIKWDESIESRFFESKFKELPKIDSEYYQKNSRLEFDPSKVDLELKELHKKIKKTLGTDELGLLLLSTVEQYQWVIELLKARGTAEFTKWSRKLYGSPKDTFRDESTTVSEMGQLMQEILSRLDEKDLGPQWPEEIDADDAVVLLQERFQRYFGDQNIRVRVSDGIVADAAAGGEVLKIREGARFTRREIDVLEVHEGWVHLATNQSGRSQPIARWLSKGPPRCVPTQEGLAVLMEIITFNSHVRRALQINHRVVAIDRAEEGADFLELFSFFREQEYSEREAFQSTMRVFRGGDIRGGAPFTKDIAYCRGFVENYNFIRTAIRAGKPKLIPFLFVGKVSLDDIPLLYKKYLEGIVEFPRYLPPQFSDLNGLAVWMSFSSVFNRIDLQKVQSYYASLFDRHS